MSVVVFGSINMDLVARSPRLPVPGETLTGYDFTAVPGGKGANQAVAAARLGLPTQMVGRVGSDSFGRELLAHLNWAGVKRDRLYIDPSAHSGVAMIAVDDRAENHIIVVPGANGNVGEEDIRRLRELLSSAKVLLLQLEIPMPAVVSAAQVAREFGVKVILDPAPVPTRLPEELYSLVDILTPNRIEAGQLVGFPVPNLEMAAEAALVLRDRGVETVIIKMGERGVLCMSSEERFVRPAFTVNAIDTVAAGDAFNGGLGAALAEGRSLEQAVIWGSAAGAIAVTRLGAQSAMPSRTELIQFLEKWKYRI
ncbi:MAG: ribokinase [Synechococcales cyanobacterium T60_A2020_003]|nr:ribokinase [Synechococcales cyanobacterium T60_A2020_003]